MKQFKPKFGLILVFGLIILSIFGGYYCWLFNRSLNPDNINLNDGNWLKIFSFDVQDKVPVTDMPRSKRNYLTVYYWEHGNKLDSKSASKDGNENKYDLVIVRDKIVPFGVSVISPIYREKIQFIKANDSVYYAGANLSPFNLIAEQSKKTIWEISLQWQVCWNSANKTGKLQVANLTASRIWPFGGGISGDYFFQQSLRASEWDFKYDLSLFFKGATNE